MGVSRVKNFPTRAPVGMLLGAVLGFLSIVPVFVIWHHYEPPLERFYFPQYVGSTLAQTPIGTVISFFNSRRNTRTYFVLVQGGMPVTSATGLAPGGHISVRFVKTTPHIFSIWLQNQIYAGREFREVLQTPLALWTGIGLSLLLSGLILDFQRRKRAREGVPLRGPDLMTRRAFNRATKGDGFKLHVFD
jgi:hypothetical protein